MADQKDPKDFSAIDTIKSSKGLYKNILSKFRGLNDLCKQTNLYTEETILKVDTIGMSFREMGLESASAARIVTIEFLEKAIILYSNIEDMEPEVMKTFLIILGGKAEEIAKLYKIIAAWAFWLSDQYNNEQKETVTEVKAYQDKYEDAVKRAIKVRDAQDQAVEKAKKQLESAHDDLVKWEIIAGATLWIPFVGLGTSIKESAVESDYYDTKRSEREEEEKLTEAKNKLKYAKTEKEKALVIAERAGEMVGVLKTMGNFCDMIQIFWDLEAKRFLKQGKDMIQVEAEDVNMLPTMRRIAKKDIPFWQSTKTDLTEYADFMAVVMTGFNFATSAVSPPSQKITIAKLAFFFNIPAAIKPIVEKILRGESQDEEA